MTEDDTDDATLNDHPASATNTNQVNPDGSGSDDINAPDDPITSDDTTNDDSLGISIVGSPAAGTVENIMQNFTFKGYNNANESDQDTVDDDSTTPPSPGQNGPTGYPTEHDYSQVIANAGDIGSETVGITGNSTVSITDPVTLITVSDTIVNPGSSMTVGINQIDEDEADITEDQASGPDIPESDEEHSTNDDDLKETIDGSDNETETIKIFGTSPDGMSINSTETIGTNDSEDTDNGPIDDHDIGSETSDAVSNQLTTDTEGDTDTVNSDITMTIGGTDGLVSTVSLPDPTTGLTTTVSTTDNASDNETDEEIDNDQDVHTTSPAIGNNNTDDITFDDKVIESGGATDNPTTIVTVQGTDAQGNQSNLQQTTTFNVTATDSGTDEDIGEEDEFDGDLVDEGDTETLHDDAVSHAVFGESIIGTLITVDPTTQIKTVTTDNSSVTGTDDQHDHDGETDTETETPAGGSESDTINQTDTDPMVLVVNANGTVTVWNPDGSPLGAPTNITNNGTVNFGASVTFTGSPGGRLTPAVSSTDPNVSLTPAAANIILGEAAPLSSAGKPAAQAALGEQESNIRSLIFLDLNGDTLTVPIGTNSGDGTPPSSGPSLPGASYLAAQSAQVNQRVADLGSVSAGPPLAAVEEWAISNFPNWWNRISSPDNPHVKIKRLVLDPIDETLSANSLARPKTPYVPPIHDPEPDPARASAKFIARQVPFLLLGSIRPVAGGAISLETAPNSGPILGQANPRSLLSRQGPLEMTPSRVQSMSEDMMVNRFSWGRTGPIEVAEGPNGVRIIIDGHHRAAAAIEAGLDNVPIRIQQVSPARWNQLMQEVLQVGEGGKMETKEQQLLELAREFISLQRSLVEGWREANPSSHDLEMLLDFPKPLARSS